MSLLRSKLFAVFEQAVVGDEWPFSSYNERTIEAYIEYVINDTGDGLNLLYKANFEHPCPGYASYVDCIYYRDDDAFHSQDGDGYRGLVVLFSRLSPYYVVGEGHTALNDAGVPPFLPSFEFVDEFQNRQIQLLEQDVCRKLERHGFLRLFKDDLAEFLPPDIQSPTTLTDPPWRLFDALIYRQD